MKTFKIDDEQLEKINAWMETRNPGAYTGAIGGRLTYEFSPTSLGVVLVVRDAMGEEPRTLDVSDYMEW